MLNSCDRGKAFACGFLPQRCLKQGRLFHRTYSCHIAASVCRILEGWPQPKGRFLLAAVVDERLKNELSRAGLQDLRGDGFLIEVVGSPLRVSGCREDGAVVVLENL